MHQSIPKHVPDTYNKQTTNEMSRKINDEESYSGEYLDIVGKDFIYIFLI